MHDLNPPAATSETFETTIEKLLTGGAGLGRCEGRAAFVPLAAPGDHLRARVTRRKRGFVEAELVELLSPGPGRRPAPCPHFGDCGGCDLQHLDAPAQRAAKAEIVADCFRRLGGGIDVTALLAGPDAAGPEFGYRDRIRLVADPTGRYGLLRRGTRETVPIETCAQMPDAFNATILPWLRLLPPAQEIVVRLDGAGGFLVSLFGLPNRARLLKRLLRELPDEEPPLPGCVGVLYNNLPLWGRNYLLVRVAGRTFRVGAASFFQSNLAETEAVIATARAWLAESRVAGGLLADLYCGVGLFGLSLADRFDRVVMVEAETAATRDARANVAHARAVAARFEVTEGQAAAVMADWAAALDAGAAKPTAVPAGASSPPAPTRGDWASACAFVDPPRTGLGEAVTAALERLAPRDILYLSCDPATLARDVAALVKGGYAARRLRLFDMFPQTAHVEVLAHLSRA